MTLGGVAHVLRLSKRGPFVVVDAEAAQKAQTGVPLDCGTRRPCRSCRAAGVAPGS
jgi:hypothetical protein